MDFNQGRTSISTPHGGDSGDRKWQEDLDRRKERARDARYGISQSDNPYSSASSSRRSTPLEGMITIATTKPPKNRATLPLRLGHREFTLAQIESVLRL